MNPIKLYSQILERYKRYIETTFYFKDPVLRKSFHEAFKSEFLSKGPYIEVTPVYKRGQKTSELLKELLPEPPDESFLKAMIGDRLLYLHQENSIRKLFGKKRNVVVSTGTASGKTETFLYPILLHLLREFQKKELCHGVRALILYPMNALANDQRDRLGEICKRLQEANSLFKFSFGQYIGETPENEKDTRRYAKSHIDNRLPGELVLRNEMRNNPPNILLTNYSMLEYMLIRPDDSPLFDNGQAKWWTFLVLDEAHQYRGSKGIEMGMLIRRLKRRLREGGYTASFQCIATSATIAGGDQDKTAVAKFASVLFGEEFKEEDIILGVTEKIPHSGEFNLSIKDYKVLKGSLDSNSSNNLKEITERVEITIPNAFDMNNKVGFILQHDNRSTKLRNIITSNPIKVTELADEIFPDLVKEDRIDAVSELVELLLHAKEPYSGKQLLSTRYHFFLRSLAGVYMSYHPNKRIFLELRGQDEGAAVFEVAICRECGQHYIVGRFNKNDDRLREAIRDPGHPGFGATFFRPIEKNIDKINNEENNQSTRKIFRLCIECGAMVHFKQKKANQECGHENSILVELQEGTEEKEDQIPRCSACGYRAPDPVREVVHGTDGPHVVITTTLHQKLPKDRRKILAFSDGRQEAAFFAWYLENSYKDILNRNLIFKAIKKLSMQTQEGLSLSDLEISLRDIYLKNKMFPPSTSDLKLKHEVWKRIYREFLTDEQRISLEGVGLLRWHIKWPEKFEIPEILISSPLSLNKNEAQDLIFILFDFMRMDKAVELKTENDVSLSWGDLNIQASQKNVRIGPPLRNRTVRSWDGKTGKRAQFLAKVLMKKGLNNEEAVENAIETLQEIWESFRQNDELLDSQDRFLIHVEDACRINPDWWRVSQISDNDFIFHCDTCARLQTTSVDNVCLRHKCPGSVKKIQKKELETNHYRSLYEDDLPYVLNVEEHTAQINKEKARYFQRKFKEGKIHVLSSSTTFELGVNLGDLDTIFLRNVPPETFNYTQRVGRAGRSGNFPGFAITFCRTNPHDLYHYVDPGNRIIKGIIKPPVISLKNKKIIIRHMVATTLSYFFRGFPERFKNVEKLLMDIEYPSGVSDFYRFLQKERTKLEESLKDIVPKTMLSEVGLDTGKWIQQIVDKKSNFARAELEVSSDFKDVKELENISVAKRDYQTAEWANRRLETIVNEDSLSFLSRKAIIPKYGFPVDVVELDTLRTQQTYESSEILLQRDLSIAIAEFAPSSRIVANKKEWTSYGIKKVAGKELERKYYWRCSKHNFFICSLSDQPEISEKCCNSIANGQYLIPKFGFVTDRQKPVEPKGRSGKVFTTRPHFIGLTGKDPGELNFGGVKLTKVSPGLMVLLCEGKKCRGFYICSLCGAGFQKPERQHKTPYGYSCSGTIEQVSLGHEFVTDVIRIKFLLRRAMNNIDNLWFSYSLAYALVEGSADVLEVPSTDLNATVAYSSDIIIPPIILYDNVPGGAGLVARLEEKEILYNCLNAALERVSGGCGCGFNDSCYGCLRNYRNQFAHTHLKRGPVLVYLQKILEEWK